MNLIIDNREKEIKKYFNNKNNVEFQNLDLGDICFYYNNELILLIERKTLNDLASSIKSKRYNEQKLRLMNNIENDKILYLIEGDLNNQGDKIDGISKKAFYSSYISLLIRDNLKIYQTKNIDETIEWIEKIYMKLLENPEKLLKKKINNDNNDKNQSINNINNQYSEFIKLKKKDNITPEICFISQLSQIPGISNTIAKHIVSHYKTMGQLCKELLENPQSINEFKYLTETNKERKMGKKGEKIYEFLFKK